MRYFIQFLVPALIFFTVVYLVTRHRRRAPAEGASDTGTFLLILVIGALVAVAVAFGLGSYLEV